MSRRSCSPYPEPYPTLPVGVPFFFLPPPKQHGKTPLFCAVRSRIDAARARDHAECVRLLAARGAHLEVSTKVREETRSPGTATTFLLAAHLPLTPPASAPPQDGWNPLHVAAQYCPIEILQALLEAGAFVNRAWADGRTALMCAAFRGRADAVALLLRAGAKPDAAEAASRQTALHKLARAVGLPGAAACCEALLCAGAFASSTDVNGRTPLHYAVTEGNTEVAAVLLAFGCRVPEHLTLGDSAEALRKALAEAQAVVRRQLEELRSPEAQREAAAELEAAVAAGPAPAPAQGCPFARLRALRAGALPWEEAWRRAPAAQPPRRFGAAVSRLARARALRTCVEKAESAAAERTVAVLRQLHDAPEGSRERETLAYAAAACVAKWGLDIKQEASAEAAREMLAAEAAVEAAAKEGEEMLEKLRKTQEEAAATRTSVDGR